MITKKIIVDRVMITKEDNMQAIFSCKMFRNSPRQDKIKAAFADPINKELVQQLAEYLDEPYRGSDDDKKSADTSSKDTQDVDNSSEETPSTKNIRKSESSARHGATPPPHSTKPDHHLSEMLKDEESGSSQPDEEPKAEGSIEDESAPKESKDLGESTQLSGETIQASEIPQGCPLISTADDIDAIVGLLNSVDETTGVRSATIKSENELWIYYKDSINLNNIMEPVISTLNAADYSYLNFNRLARTDNAIVFEIQMTPKKVQSIEEVKDEK